MATRIVRMTIAVLVLAGTFGVAVAGTATCRGKRATLRGTAGNDHLVGTSGRDVIAGGGGDDFIEPLGGADLVCGGSGADQIYAQGGNDTILGGGGSDDLVGGAGNDTILAGGAPDYLNGGAGDDQMDGGRAGFDYADFRTSAGGVEVDLALGSVTGDGNDSIARVEMVAGTHFDDVLRGASGDFELYLGLAGNDTIDGRDGFDQLIFEESTAGVTADSVAGTATGEGEDDFSSIESLVGSNFDDVLRGHEESDDIYGLAGNDTIDGRGGDDYILGFEGDDDLAGGAGQYDMIDFESDASAVTVDMASGVSSGQGADTVSGFEIIGGSPHDDVLIGGPEDDLFFGYGGSDTIDGGDGSDLTLYLHSEAVRIDLPAGTALAGDDTDTLASVEGFVGSSFGDTFVGDDAVNVLIGGGGPDELSGGGGDDYIDGGSGSDIVDGGGGAFDMVDYYAAPAGITADLQAGTATGFGNDTLAGIEALLGSPFADSFLGDGLTNYLFGAGGNDDLRGGDGDDGLDGGDGNDALDGGGGSDDCAGGESQHACETGGQTEPAADVEALQALVAALSQMLGGGPD